MATIPRLVLVSSRSRLEFETTTENKTKVQESRRDRNSMHRDLLETRPRPRLTSRDYKLYFMNADNINLMRLLMLFHTRSLVIISFILMIFEHDIL